MKQRPPLKKLIIPIMAVVVGLVIGLGVGQFQIKKEQKIFQTKIKEAGKKMAFIQKKTAQEKSEAVLYAEQQCQGDLDKLKGEKDVLGGQLGKFKEQARLQEAKIKEIEAAATKTQKELQETGQKYAQVLQQKKELENNLKKMTAERDSLQAGLNRTNQNLSRCEENNARLCIIAEELVTKYRNKGIGKAILEKEPLTQIKKVDLEQITQEYREQIEQQKFKKK